MSKATLRDSLFNRGSSWKTLFLSSLKNQCIVLWTALCPFCQSPLSLETQEMSQIPTIPLSRLKLLELQSQSSHSFKLILFWTSKTSQSTLTALGILSAVSLRLSTTVWPLLNKSFSLNKSFFLNYSSLTRSSTWKFQLSQKKCPRFLIPMTKRLCLTPMPGSTKLTQSLEQRLSKLLNLLNSISRPSKNIRLSTS